MKKVDCIIVTYNPIDKLEENIKVILPQIRKLYIVDNNSSSKEVLKKLEENSKIDIIYNKINIGLGAAQNLGIEKSINNNSDWILIFDDDTEIPNQYIDKLLKAYKKNRNNKVTIIFPKIEHKNSEKQTLYVEYDKNLKILKNINEDNDKILLGMASGSLIKSSILKEIGLFKEKYFIEYIDYEFCLRNRKKGYLNLLVSDISLVQRVGNTKDIKFGKLCISPSRHNPNRLYYKIRNLIWMTKEYHKDYLSYFIYDYLKTIWIISRSLIFETNKVQRVKNIGRGIIEGVKM